MAKGYGMTDRPPVTLNLFGHLVVAVAEYDRERECRETAERERDDERKRRQQCEAALGMAEVGAQGLEREIEELNLRLVESRAEADQLRRSKDDAIREHLRESTRRENAELAANGYAHLLECERADWRGRLAAAERERDEMERRWIEVTEILDKGPPDTWWGRQCNVIAGLQERLAAAERRAEEAEAKLRKGDP